MNKLIKQFERQSGIEVYGLGLDKVKWESRLEEFAQMIIRECRDIVGKTRDTAIEDEWNVDEAMSTAMYDIEEHFGVNNEPTT